MCKNQCFLMKINDSGQAELTKDVLTRFARHPCPGWFCCISLGKSMHLHASLYFLRKINDSGQGLRSYHGPYHGGGTRGQRPPPNHTHIYIYIYIYTRSCVYVFTLKCVYRRLCLHIAYPYDEVEYVQVRKYVMTHALAKRPCDNTWSLSLLGAAALSSPSVLVRRSRPDPSEPSHP